MKKTARFPLPVLNLARLDMFARFSTAPKKVSQRTRERAEDKLRRSEAFLAISQRLSQTGSFSWRVETDEITWSEELYRIFEFDQSLPVTLDRIGTRVHPKDMWLLNEMIDRARREASDLEYEHRLLMLDQTIKYVHLAAHATRYQHGQLVYIGAIQEVTRRRLAEEALGKIQSELAHAARVASLGAMTAAIAHEVNQPLTAVANNANACLNLLPASVADFQEVRAALAEIIEDAERASAVVGRVRQLVRKEALAKAPLKLGDIVTEVSTIARYEAAAQHVTIRTEVSGDLPPVMADRVQLQQVLLNLVVNAVDAMRTIEEPERILTIRAKCQLRNAVPNCLICVQDAGIGFKSDEAERLFEPFYTTKSHGTGMGLTISRSIIEAHGGHLWAEPNQGAGATFLLSLPTVGNGAT
jgi:C4-dicarboxylate-specific signal transduction histidine kinase